MSLTNNLLRAATIVSLGLLLVGTALAQFGGVFPGMVNLPADDFVWQWGNQRDAARGRFQDFSARGGEASFRCDLTGGLSVSNSWSNREIRQFENDLNTSMTFIQSAAYAMYVLDQQRDLDWAVLDCDRYEREETADELQEKEDKARARAERRREQRRARREREEARANSE